VAPRLPIPVAEIGCTKPLQLITLLPRNTREAMAQEHMFLPVDLIENV